MDSFDITLYIAPGEFSFCPRCGRPESCVPSNISRNCLKCAPVKPDLTKEMRDAEKRTDKICKGVYGLRKLIAKLRKESGYKPYFWKESKDGS